MGINTHYYTVYGVRLDAYDADFVEHHYEHKQKDENTPDVISDGMGGEYMIFGKILFDSGDLRYNDINDVFVTIDTTSLDEIKRAYIGQFEKTFPECMSLISGLEWKLMTFMHLS